MDDFLNLQVYKLGHEVEEIRLRALDNILAKLEVGLLSFGVLVDSPDFVKNLIRWLSYSPTLRAETIFKLLLQAAQEGRAGDILQNDPQLKILDKASRPDCRGLFNEISEICSRLSLSCSSEVSCLSVAPSESNIVDDRGNFWISLCCKRLSAHDQDTLSAVARSLRDPSRSAHAIRFISSIILSDFPPSCLLCRNSLGEVLLDLAGDRGENSQFIFDCLEILINKLVTEVKYYKNIHMTPIFYNASESNHMEVQSLSGSDESSSLVLYKEYSGSGCGSAEVDDTLPLGVFVDRVLSCAITAGFGRRLSEPIAKLREEAATKHVPSSQLIDALTELAASHTLKGDHHLFETQLLTWVVLKDWTFSPGCLPGRLLQAIQKWALDPTLTLFFPDVINHFTELLSKVEWGESSLQREAVKIAGALNAASIWIKDYETLASADTLAPAVDIFASSIDALEYHRQYSMIAEFIDLALDRYDSVESEGLGSTISTIILRLLACSDVAVQRVTVTHMSAIAISQLGPASSCQRALPISALRNVVIHPQIIIHLVSFSFISSDDEVSRESKDIVAALLRCRSTLGKSDWDLVAQELLVVLPYLLAAAATAGAPVSPAVLALLDPDLAPPTLSHTTVLLGNIGLLLSRDATTREEAISRLMFLLDIPSRPVNLVLPHDPISAQPGVLGVYEGESVLRVLEVLRDKRMNGRVIRSSLVQLSLMTEDHTLHELFLAHGGLSILLDRINPSCDDFKEVFGPIVSSLRNIVKHNSKIRKQLQEDESVLRNIVKGMFCVCCDWRTERDASQLLALLAFGDCVIVDSSGRISLPKSVLCGIRSPFPLASHEEAPKFSSPSFKEELIHDSSCQKLLAAHWAVGLAGGTESLLEHGLQTVIEAKVAKELEPPRSLLKSISAAHPGRNVANALEKLASASSHARAFDAIEALERYLWVCVITKWKLPLDLPWERVLIRYLQTPPASTTDQQLLKALIFSIIRYYDLILGDADWLVNCLQGPSSVLIYLLKQTSNEKCSLLKKETCVGWLKLLYISMKRNQCEINFTAWRSVMFVLIEALNDRHSQRFYSLGTIKGILKCLVLLKMNNLKPGEAEDCSKSAVSALCNILPAFRSNSTSSYMGVCILRLTLLALNNFLTANPNILPEFDIGTVSAGLNSCDYRLRAATLQLLCTLTRPRLPAKDVILWQLGLRLLLDGGEVNVVRQMAASLCSTIIHNRPNCLDIAVECREKGLFRYIGCLVTSLTYDTKLSLAQISNSRVDSSVKSVSDSSCNYTDRTCPPELLIVCIELVTNIIVACPEYIVSIQQQNLSCTLFRFVGKWCTLDRISSGNKSVMMRLVCKLLAMCPSHCPISNLQQVLSSLIWLLQPSSFSLDSSDCSDLWTEVLNLLSLLVAHHQKDVKIALTSECVATICNCVETPNPADLQLAALSAIPSLVHILDPRSAEAIGRSTAIAWDRESRLGRARGKACGSALGSLLAASHAATSAAIAAGVIDTLITRLRQAFVDLSVLPTPAPTLTRSFKWNAVLSGLATDIGLLNNALAGSEAAKQVAHSQGVADCIHKLWAWCFHDAVLLSSVLQLLVTLSANFPPGAHSLVLTSTLAGTGPRKTPHSASVLHAAVGLLANSNQPASVRKMALVLCAHSCLSPESRLVLSKSSIFKNYAAFTSEKKSSSKEELELPWLDFLIVLTSYPEGQAVLLKHEDVLSGLLLRLTSSSSIFLRRVTQIFRNVSFHQANKQKLLSISKLMSAVCSNLRDCTILSVKIDLAVMIWSLAANSQRHKQQLRSLGLLPLLELAAVDRETSLDSEACTLFNTVLSVLRRIA